MRTFFYSKNILRASKSFTINHWIWKNELWIQRDAIKMAGDKNKLLRCHVYATK